MQLNLVITLQVSCDVTQVEQIQSISSVPPANAPTEGASKCQCKCTCGLQSRNKQDMAVQVNAHYILSGLADIIFRDAIFVILTFNLKIEMVCKIILSCAGRYKLQL